MKTIKLYYDKEQDIMCIVEGDKIYKYLGTLDPLNILVPKPKNKWYKAKSSPTWFKEFQFIGEL